MSVSDLMYPFTALIEWMRTNYIVLAGFQFSFMNLFTWTAGASIILGAISAWFRGD